MAQNVLQIIQTACRRIGILSPNVAVSSTDQQIIQLVELANEEGQELTERYSWQQLQTETSFTTVATQVQANMQTIAPGYKYIVNDTIWNRTLRRPVYGPKSEQDWAQDKATAINGPFNSFRLIGDAINFFPVPVAGQQCFFEYISSNWVTKNAGGSSAIWTNDLDVTKLDDQLIVMGTIWRWKNAKGLDYSEDFAKYERRVTDAIGRDGSKPVLNMTGGYYQIQPVVAVPRGSFGA